MRIPSTFLTHNTSTVFSCATANTVFINWYEVLVVGYNTAENYWIIKNSQGTTWGESGFARINMTSTNGEDCGIKRNIDYLLFERTTFVFFVLSAIIAALII